MEWRSSYITKVGTGVGRTCTKPSGEIVSRNSNFADGLVNFSGSKGQV